MKAKINLKTNRAYFTPLHYVLELVSFGCLIACFVLAVIAIRTFPETIPTHFAIDGTPDGYGSPASLLVLPIIMTPTTLLISLISHLVQPQCWNMPFAVNKSPKTARIVYQKMITMELLIQFEISVYTLWAEIQSFRLSGKGVLLACGLLMIVLIVSIVVPVVQAYRINKSDI